MLVELPFAGFFLSKLLGTSADVDIHHLASLDPEVYRNLLFLKSYGGDVEELGLNFTVVNNDLGEAQVRRAGPEASALSGHVPAGPGSTQAGPVAGGPSKSHALLSLILFVRFQVTSGFSNFHLVFRQMCLQERGIWLFLCPSIVF